MSIYNKYIQNPFPKRQEYQPYIKAEDISDEQTWECLGIKLQCLDVIHKLQKDQSLIFKLEKRGLI